MPGKLVQRSWQDNDGDKRQSVEIQVQHVGPDLQFATATVEKATAEKGTAEKQSALPERPWRVPASAGLSSRD